MTEQEYMRELRQIQKRIREKKYLQAERRLEELYRYKPVRLPWFSTKASYVLQVKKDPEQALKILEGKYFPGENYPGLKECMACRAEALRQTGRTLDAAREAYCCRRICGESCASEERELTELLELYAEDAGNMELLTRLAEKFYQTGDTAASLIAETALVHAGVRQKDEERFQHLKNYGYLEEMLEKEGKPFILAMDQYQNRAMDVLGFLISSLGHPVIVLSVPLEFETEERVELQDTLAVSLEQTMEYPDMQVIPPVALTESGIPYGDNRDYIIDWLCREKSGQDGAVLLCSGYLIEALSLREGLRGRIGRVSAWEAEPLEEKTHFAWTGSYLGYISEIYGYDVREDIEAAPRVDFSILIPARNSARTLRYTLETCLNQRYTGSYEVVVSDNSVDGNTEIRELCQELNNPKLRYIKTPRVLHLTKSFEFGFLKTRGEFVFALGSDDGLLPWGLESIRKTIDQFPQEDIIQWDRGFYAWPGFNGGQQNQFSIPGRYEKNRLSCSYVRTGEYLQALKDAPHIVYSMPILYINSGFRRRYLKHLLQKTGKLWNGNSQDLYMGVMNCFLYDRILHMNYPVSIAGMSGNSIGHIVNTAVADREQNAKYETLRRAQTMSGSSGAFVPLARERLTTGTNVDPGIIFSALSRCMQEGICTQEQADAFYDWKTAISAILGQMSVLNAGLDRIIQALRYYAKKRKEETWLEKAIGGLAGLYYVDEAAEKRRRQQKTYREEVYQNGGETVDASRFGVQNIVEAVALFERKTNL